jgi:hypothetical protein
MNRSVLFAVTPVLAAVVSVSAASAQSYTTRIETRPFYGATVTREEGVRVIRPLPPERQVIINPDGRTPLSLGFNETKVYQRSDVYNYGADEGQAPVRGYGYGGWYGGVGPGLRHGSSSQHSAPGGVGAGIGGHFGGHMGHHYGKAHP